MERPIGDKIDFTGPWPVPSTTALTGQYCRLERAALAHSDDLFHAYSQDPTGQNWTYLPYGLPMHREAFEALYKSTCFGADPYFFVVVDPEHGAVGWASYLRINARDGSIEVGWISFSPLMQRSRASTEAMYLMMRYAFEDLGYRRYEWKCDALNAPSRAAAERLGFTYEGTFRQATHYKGRNRDTAWFSILDHEWPTQKTRFERWLDPTNFDAAGQQKARLQDC